MTDTTMKFEGMIRQPMTREQMRQAVNVACGVPFVTGRSLHACKEAARHGDLEMVTKAVNWLEQHGSSTNHLERQTLTTLRDRKMELEATNG